MLAAVGAAESVLESPDHFWRLPLPEGWSERPLNAVMQGRLHAQAMADGPNERAVLITVRPDGRTAADVDQVFVIGLIDSYIIAARDHGLDHTRTSVTMITWDGLPAGEVTATLKEGDEVHAVLFRVLAANGFVYQVRALQQQATAVDADLRAVLDGFRLTKKPDLAVPVAGTDNPAGAEAAPAFAESDAAAEAPALVPPASGGNPLVIIGSIAGVAILVLCIWAFIPRKRRARGTTSVHRRRREPTARDELGIVPPPPKRPASQRTTARIPQQPSAERPTDVTPANRRTTVLMPQQPPDGKPTTVNEANVRRRRPNP